MKLSVLIPTMNGRESPLSRMMFTVLRQPGLNTEFEVLCHRGEGPQGDKFNRMIELALGDYVVMFDDDDWIDARYMDEVLPLLDGVDAVGYDIGTIVEGRYVETIEHRPGVGTWNGTPRGVSHKTPIRQSIAAQVPFGNDYISDVAWIQNITPLITGGLHIPEVLYFYDYRHAGPEHVGWWPYDPAQVRWL